jgi:hypothetical protein
LLAGGIAGLVVPLLSAEGPSLVDPGSLRKAAICMAMTIAVGVLTQLRLRWVTADFIHQMEERFRSETTALARASSEDELMKAYASSEELLAPNLWQAERRLLVMPFADILFYGTFLLGITSLIHGFLLK